MVLPRIHNEPIPFPVSLQRSFPPVLVNRREEPKKWLKKGFLEDTSPRWRPMTANTFSYQTRSKKQSKQGVVEADQRSTDLSTSAGWRVIIAKLWVKKIQNETGSWDESKTLIGLINKQSKLLVLKNLEGLSELQLTAKDRLIELNRLNIHRGYHVYNCLLALFYCSMCRVQ